MLEFNDEQQEAITAPMGPVLVIAGPGSGKTRCLTHRILYIIEQGMPPAKILALTFTNKAAREMRERIQQVVGKTADKIWTGTFHSICLKILRQEYKALGFSKDFRIIDEDDTKRILSSLLSKNAYISDAVSAIGMYKNQAITPEEVEGNMADIYAVYQEELHRNNLMDFDDLLFYTVRLFQTNPRARAKWQRKFRYVLVDEYQDTNHLQYLFVKLLVEKHKNLYVVGDSAQAIYGYRLADIRNILSFQDDYPEATVIHLGRNYRSTKVIVETANSIISNCIDIIPNEIWTENDIGDKIVIKECIDEAAEASFIVREIVRQNYTYGDVAILGRTHASLALVEKAMSKVGIPHKLVGGMEFYSRKEVKDILAYLRLIFDHNDNDAFTRIVNVPRRGVGNATLTKLATVSRKTNKSMWNLIEEINLPNKISKSLQEFKAVIESFAGIPFGSDLLEEIYVKTGYMDLVKDDRAREENLYTLIDIVQKYNSLTEFLDFVAVLHDTDFNYHNVVKLMTCHAAKGLEFGTVFVVGLNQETFPHFFSIRDGNEEEELRLFYVAITRAKEHLYLTYTRLRQQGGRIQRVQPSVFLRYIPENLVQQS